MKKVYVSVFAPLRGWYLISDEEKYWEECFRPPYGDGTTKYITEYRKMEELNA